MSLFLWSERGYRYGYPDPEPCPELISWIDSGHILQSEYKPLKETIRGKSSHSKKIVEISFLRLRYSKRVSQRRNLPLLKGNTMARSTCYRCYIRKSADLNRVCSISCCSIAKLTIPITTPCPDCAIILNGNGMVIATSNGCHICKSTHLNRSGSL